MSGKKYFVHDDGQTPFMTLAQWASWNTMKIAERSEILMSGERAFKLDVEYNDELRVAMRMLGGGPSLMNGERRIGSVKCDALLRDGVKTPCYLVWPEVADR